MENSMEIDGMPVEKQLESPMESQRKSTWIVGGGGKSMASRRKSTWKVDRKPTEKYMEKPMNKQVDSRNLMVESPTFHPVV